MNPDREELILLLKLLVLIFSVIFHEIAHGAVALMLGDTTARDQGRLTLNPLPHIDPFGTLLLPALLVISGSPVVIGAARPVPVRPRFFTRPALGMAVVGLSGPLTNGLIALISGLLFRFLTAVASVPDLLVSLVAYAAFINILLALFNLIPVPPLDGSRVVALFLRGRVSQWYGKLERFGFFFLVMLLYLGLFRWILAPMVAGLFHVLTGSQGGEALRI